MEEMKIPQGWKLEELGKISNIGSSKRIFESDYVQNGIPFFRGKEIIDKFLGRESKADIFISNKKYEEISKKYPVPQKNDILITAVGTIGVPYLVGEEKFYFKDGNLIWLRKIKKNLSSKYLFYIMQSNLFEKNIRLITGGSSQSALTIEKLNLIKFFCPEEFEEQEKIASILQNIDKNIESTEMVIDKQKRIKDGLMDDLLTGKIRIKDGKRYEETEFDEVEGIVKPVDWEVKSFNDVIYKFLDYRGRTPLKLGMEWGNGDILALSANNVEMGKVNTEKEAYLGSEELYKAWMTKGDLNKGDILMTLEAPLGNVVQVPDNKKYILSQRVVAIRTKKEISENYFSYFLTSEYFQRELKKKSTGTTALGISQKNLFPLQVFFPTSFDEQVEITKFIKQQEKYIKIEEKYLEKLRKLKAGLMEDLLTGKVRVKY